METGGNIGSNVLWASKCPSGPNGALYRAGIVPDVPSRKVTCSHGAELLGGAVEHVGLGIGMSPGRLAGACMFGNDWARSEARDLVRAARGGQEGPPAQESCTV